MSHKIHAADANLHIKGGRTINLTSNGKCGKSRYNLLDNMNLRQVVALVDFIINIQMFNIEQE